MSTGPEDSPVHIQPLHNPSQAAIVSLPQTANGQPGMGAKALLAKKMAKNHNPTYISPTDNLVTPVSQKLNASKKKHFAKGSAKPMPNLFASKEPISDPVDNDEDILAPAEESSEAKMLTDEENPF